METKLIRIDKKAWDIIRLEAIRQTFKTSGAISMGNVIAKFAERLNKKHKHIAEAEKL